MQVKSGEAVLELKSPQQIYDELKDSDFAASRIPELEFTEGAEASAKINLVTGKNKEATFEPEIDRYTVKGDLEDLEITQLTYLIFSAAEREREKQGKYTFHGSGVSSDKGVLFLGHPNSGKTASSLTMALDFDYDFVGDDRVMVNDKQEIIGGNKLVPLNHYNFESLGLEKYGFTKPPKGEEKCVERSRFGNPSQTEIDLIAFPEILQKDELEVREMSDKEATFRLFQDVSPTARTSGYVLLDWDQPYPSFDSEDIAQLRYDNMKTLANDTDVVELYGTLEDITSWVDQQY